MDASHPERLSLSSPLNQHPLSADGQYLCPICRQGQITQLTLMEAFACSFCRHIFEMDYRQQSVRVVDSTQQTLWRWVGDRWVSLGQQAGAAVIWIIAVILGLLPPSIVGMAVYMFPPLPGSRWAWLPVSWSLVALLLHGLLATWIVVEYYQPPLYAANKVRVRRWLQQFAPQS